MPLKTRRTTVRRLPKRGHYDLETIAAIRDESSQAVALAALSEIYEANDFELTVAEKEILLAVIRKAES